MIEIDIANAPPIDRTAEVAPKKKKEAPAAAAASTPAEATPAKAEAAAEGQEGKTAKKEKKKGKETAGGEAGGKKAAKAAPAPAEDAGPPKPSMIQLLVGKIVDSAYILVFLVADLSHFSLQLSDTQTPMACTWR